MRITYIGHGEKTRVGCGAILLLFFFMRRCHRIKIVESRINHGSSECKSAAYLSHVDRIGQDGIMKAVVKSLDAAPFLL
jgi:hypothetical protein